MGHTRRITTLYKDGPLETFCHTWMGDREPTKRLVTDWGTYVCTNRDYQGRYIYRWEPIR